jgi:hypothetical protein
MEKNWRKVQKYYVHFCGKCELKNKEGVYSLEYRTTEYQHCTTEYHKLPSMHQIQKEILILQA